MHYFVLFFIDVNAQSTDIGSSHDTLTRTADPSLNIPIRRAFSGDQEGTTDTMSSGQTTPREPVYSVPHKTKKTSTSLEPPSPEGRTPVVLMSA